MTRRPRLSDYDEDDDANPQARADRARLTRPDNRVPGTRWYDLPISQPGCWCGDQADHDWPGKADGVPHPRDEQPL